MTSKAGDDREPADGHGTENEVGVLVGRLSADQDLTKAERRRLLGRLMRSLGRVRRGPRWLADAFLSAAPRIPIRDLPTLQEHHHGLTGEALADALVRAAANRATAVGAAAGALAAAEFAAPPLLLTVPAQLTAETLVVAAIELKLVAELHSVYEIAVPGAALQRGQAFAMSWAKRRGIDPMAPGTLTTVLGTAARTALRKRLLKLLGRNLTTLGPYLTGAVAGAAINRAATRRLAEAIRHDLRNGPRSLPA